MPAPPRQSKKYFLSVEGETEKWYFEHLCKLVNASEEARYKLTLKCDVEKEPLAMAKRLVIPKRTTIDVFESEGGVLAPRSRKRRFAQGACHTQIRKHDGHGWQSDADDT